MEFASKRASLRSVVPQGLGYCSIAALGRDGWQITGGLRMREGVPVNKASIDSIRIESINLVKCCMSDFDRAQTLLIDWSGGPQICLGMNSGDLERVIRRARRFGASYWNGRTIMGYLKICGVDIRRFLIDVSCFERRFDR